MTRILSKYVVDVCLWTVAALLAFILRLDGYNQWVDNAAVILTYISIGLIPKLFLSYRFGLFRQSWHKVSVRDLYQLIKSIGALTFVSFVAALMFSGTNLSVPRSVPLIEGLLALVMLSGVRLVYRLYHERRRGGVPNGNSKRVLIAGAGEAGTLLARELLRHPETGQRPVGFLDDNPVKQRERFLGLPVLGNIDDLPRVVVQMQIDEVLVSIPSAPGSLIRHITELSREANVRCKTIPGVYEIISGRVSISQIREVRLEDLLRREPVRLNLGRICEYLDGRVVMVTGAGGSIGSEIVRQVTRFNPQKILLVGRGENSLYHIERELDRCCPGTAYETIVANVQQLPKVDYIFQKYRPQVIFHAAAHKHVPLMELNPDEAVFNNVMGTQNLVECAVKYGFERFVNISTDKAVNPTSVMGATKRVAEYMVQRGVARAQDNQVFISVRFGNVLGSRGSVVPLFQEQIRMGGPVTVTHSDMTRYFMTIPEAAQLVVEAGSIGENGVTYVLDMGEPVKIVDLAKDLIQLSGLSLGKDIEVVTTGMRPGEKMYEEIVAASETVIASPHEKIFAVQCGTLPIDLEPLTDELFAAAATHDAARIRKTLRRLISTYGLPEAARPAEERTEKLRLNLPALPTLNIPTLGPDAAHESAASGG
jgi:FlaA1/EpsC-like NDP-sugar epimerase